MTETKTRYNSSEDQKNLRDARANGVTTAETWEAYIRDEADNFGVSYSTARVIFDMLGSTEAFDGFITTMEDAEGMELD